MQAGDAQSVATAKAYTDNTATQTLSSANSYTDARFNAWNQDLDGYKQGVDRRFAEQDRRIDRQGAMNAAMLNMATSAAGIHTENRVGVGVGFQGGENALSVGYQRALSERATITVGGAFSGDERSVGVGAGFGW
ncbi:YadA-like family protein [Pseudoxanthomonas winnipegensis]|nr:YadA-like family protein [Pseudoxanthomonas winnipegensis]